MFTVAVVMPEGVRHNLIVMANDGWHATEIAKRRFPQGLLYSASAVTLQISDCAKVVYRHLESYRHV